MSGRASVPNSAPARRILVAYTRPTGHPPPAEQVRNQVRTATGYTLGRATPEGPRIAVIGVRAVPLAAVARLRAPSSLPTPGAPETGLLADRLLAFLEALAAAGSGLPLFRVIAAEIGASPGNDAGVNAVYDAMRRLESTGEIRVWRGSKDNHFGQRIIGLRDGGIVRSARAPEGIVP